MEDGVSFAKIDFAGSEQFHALRRELGVTSFGMNVISLQTGQRLRIHRHAQQEEVYVVLNGVLTLTIEEEDHALERGSTARVAPAIRRQLTNRDPGLLVVLAVGGAGHHEGRDGEAFNSWDETHGRPPQEVPLPPDVEP